MLAPDDLDPIIGALNGFHANVRAADSISAIFKSFTIHPVHNEADWVTQLRGQMPSLSNTGEAWKTGKLTILPGILSPLIAYYNRFKSVAAYLPHAEDGQAAASILDRLIVQIEGNVAEAREAKNVFSEWVKDAKLHTNLLDESITKAWSAIGSSEKKIVALSEQIVQVQNDLSSLDGVISLNSISGGSISSAKSILSEVASMIYSVAIQGIPLPVLSVGVSFFTLGKMFYDIFSTSSKIDKELAKLKQYRFDLTFEQLSLAQTKAALMYVYDMKVMLERQSTTLRELEAFWQNELRTVNTVRQNFALAEHYTKDNPEVLQLPIAQSVWFSLRDCADDILDSFNRSAVTKSKINLAL